MQQQSLTLTLGIIGVTVLASWYAFDKPNIIRRFLMSPNLVERDHQYYRFISSGLLHANFSHLLWNMFSLYFFGTVVEKYFAAIFGNAGSYYFIAFYILAIIISDIPTYFKQRHNPAYTSLGASGGVAAVIFASIIFQPLQGICFYFVFCLPGFILGTGYLAWSYYKGKKANDNINHEAHLYGALFGLLFCACLYPSSIPNFFLQLMQWKPFE